MKESVKLILDLGNSETRVQVKFTDRKTGQIVKRKFEQSNRFYKTTSGAVIPANYKPDKTSVIAISGEYVGYYANGELVEKEYEKVCMKPTASTPKYSQQSALSFALAVINAVKVISEYNRVGRESLDISWKITTLMPASNCTVKEKELLSNEFKKIIEVDDLFTEDRKPFKIKVDIDSVEVHPEGFAAYVGCIYDENLNIRAGYEEFVDEPVLILDIGAGTTNRMIIEGSQIIDNTKDSVPIGGNNVRAKSRRYIKEKYNYEQLLDSQIEEAMKTGIVKDGKEDIDVSSEIMKGKSEVAKSLVDDLQEYLSGIDFSIRRVRGLLPVGGGTLSGDTEKITSIADIAVDFLKQFAPNIEKIPLPKVPSEKENGKLVEMSPRELNIEGASILTDVEDTV